MPGFSHPSNIVPKPYFQTKVRYIAKESATSAGAVEAIRASNAKLSGTYIDLLLAHPPCKSQGILLEAYLPRTKAKTLGNAVLNEIAKPVNPARQQENLDAKVHPSSSQIETLDAHLVCAWDLSVSDEV
ncbi:putative oxidoreductase [Globisporangium polare]